jgi:hypothetical protein
VKDPLTAAQTTLLEAALLPGADAVRAWQEWRDGIDWHAHLDHEEYALLPLVYRNLHQLKLDEPLFPRFKGVIHHAWLKNLRMISELSETLASLADNAVEVLILPPTLRMLFSSSAVINWQQPYNWAIHPGQAESAIRSLLSCGWHASGVHLPNCLLSGYVAGTQHLLLQHDNQQQLMLSWGLEWWFDQRVAAVWKRASKYQLAGQPVRGLDPTDALEFELRQALTNKPFGQVANVVFIVAITRSVDWLRLEHEVRHRPLSTQWFSTLTVLQPLLNQWGAPPNLSNWCAKTVNDKVITQPSVSVLKRLRSDWKNYSLLVGDRGTLLASLMQLPGYLMGRWKLTHWSGLGRGLLRWIRPNMK